jgi:hypothetical protein
MKLELLTQLPKEKAQHAASIRVPEKFWKNWRLQVCFVCNIQRSLCLIKEMTVYRSVKSTQLDWIWLKDVQALFLNLFIYLHLRPRKKHKMENRIPTLNLIALTPIAPGIDIWLKKWTNPCHINVIWVSSNVTSLLEKFWQQGERKIG